MPAECPGAKQGFPRDFTEKFYVTRKFLAEIIKNQIIPL